MAYFRYEDIDSFKSMMEGEIHPTFVEMILDEEIGLTPNLPKGLKCQDMEPELSSVKYDFLNRL